MIDRFFYNFFATVDKVISFMETYAVKYVEWCWGIRVKLLKKKRKRKKR
jgi:hypothetical protein